MNYSNELVCSFQGDTKTIIFFILYIQISYLRISYICFLLHGYDLNIIVIPGIDTLVHLDLQLRLVSYQMR